MHNAATHFAVSDALITLAMSPANPAALEAARQSVEHARKWAQDCAEAENVLLALQDNDVAVSSDTDARMRAWTLGIAFARREPQSPRTAVLAAVIAMGECLPGTADFDLVSAVAVGSDAAERLINAMNSDEYEARWNVASSLGVVAATLAVARLIGLDTDRARHAMGIAATQAAGLARNGNEPMSAVEVGKAAADAIESSLLAKHGFTSAVASIDGRRGLAALMAYRFDASAITGEPGDA
jgi:hypothetical protein